MTPHRSLTQVIPEYLMPFVAVQDPELYTAIDHASWRFILKLSKSFFSSKAHQKYLDGLEQTGISEDRIPLIREMDEKLKKFGWRAVAVSGFIPPAIFMEFLSLGILPIACDMRKVENISYTPAPDIVHEAAGHAPIIADPNYSNYLRSYGEISKRAIFSWQDLGVYFAIRKLSDTKENPASTLQAVASAQKELDEALAQVTFVSEATQLARMSWWTIEYGLVGEENDPKIYGAGLLSSLGESYHCFDREVRKIPLSLDCIQQGYDITKPQPQLFVARDFAQTTQILEQLGDTMAFRRGGEFGLSRAKQAQTVTTTQLDSGIQLSGILSEFRKDQQGRISFLKLNGPCQVSESEIELQGTNQHPDGYSTPIGRLREIQKPLQLLNEAEQAKINLAAGKRLRLEYESGITVDGLVQRIYPGKSGAGPILISLTDCNVEWNGEILFDRSWGTYDLACGDQVTSVYGNAADRAKYWRDTGMASQATSNSHTTNLTPENQSLNTLYARVRKEREAAFRSADHRNSTPFRLALNEIHESLEKEHPNDWLLRYELLELDIRFRLAAPWGANCRQTLNRIAAKDQTSAEMIARGLALV